MRVISWFSCGAASAVATKLAIAESIIKQQELEIKRLKTIIEAYKIRPRGKSEFAGQTHLGVYLGEK